MNQELLHDMEEFREALIREEYPNLTNASMTWMRCYFEYTKTEYTNCERAYAFNEVLEALESNKVILFGYVLTDCPWFDTLEPDITAIEQRVNKIFTDKLDSVVAVIYKKESCTFTYKIEEIGFGRHINDVIFQEKLHEVTVEHCKPNTAYTESKYNHLLKPCPFCGKRAVLRENAVNLVFCEDVVNCGAQLEQSEAETPEDTANYCISAWNSRTIERY